MEIIFDLLLPVVIFLFALVFKKGKDLNLTEKMDQKFKQWEEQINTAMATDDESIPSHPFEPQGQEHDNTRDHRIYEQETKVQANTESVARHKRLKDQKIRLERKPIQRMARPQTTVVASKPKHLVTNTVFRDQEEVRKALIYGEILGTPVSQQKNRRF